MNTGLFVSQNLFEGLLKGINCQKVKEGVVLSSLNSAGELKEIYSNFLKMLAEISSCEEMPLSICTSLEEVKELVAIQRFFETKSKDFLKESNLSSFGSLIAQNQERSDIEKNFSNNIFPQTIQWNSDQFSNGSEEDSNAEFIMDGRNYTLKDIFKTLLENRKPGVRLISENEMTDSNKLIDEESNLSQTVEGLIMKSDMESPEKYSLSSDINPAVKESVEFDVKDELYGGDESPDNKQEEKAGDMLKSRKAFVFEKFGNIIEAETSAVKTLKNSEDVYNLKTQSLQKLKLSEAGPSSTDDIYKISDTSTGLNNRFLKNGTISTEVKKGISGVMAEDNEMAEEDLYFKGIQELKKGELLHDQKNGISLKKAFLQQQIGQVQNQEDGISLRKEFLRQQNGQVQNQEDVISLKKEFTQQQSDQVQTKNSFSEIPRNVISLNRELIQEDYVLNDSVKASIKSGFYPERGVLNPPELSSSEEDIPIKQGTVADDGTVIIIKTENMAKVVAADKGDGANIRLDNSGYDNVKNKNSIQDQLVFKDISLKMEKTDSKPDNTVFESGIRQENVPDKAPFLGRFDSNDVSGMQEKLASRTDYSGWEAFTKNEIDIQGYSIEGKKKNEITVNRVDERSLNIESDIKDSHVLSSNKNSSEINQGQVSQTKNSAQLQRPLQFDLLNQIVEKAVVNLKNGHTSINIALKPDYLGRLRMQISTENNQVVVKVMTDVPMVKEIMETNLSQLRSELQNHGLEIEKFDVFLNDGSKNDSSEHGRWLSGKTDRSAKETIKPDSITEEMTPLVAFVESGKGSGHIDCMA